MKPFKKNILFYFLGLISLFNVSLSQTITQEVVVKVYSTTYASGINQGLIDAIGMVNGRSIESESLMSLSQIKENSNKESSYFQSQEFQSKMKDKTKGVVQSYEILSSNKTPEGGFELEMKVLISKLKKSKSANRKRIAVIDLNYRGDCCYYENSKYNGITVGQELSNAISTNLVQSRKFTVLDRRYQNQVANEKKRLTAGNVPVSELVKLGEELFADYILVGTVNSFNIKKTERKMLSSNMIINSIKANASINYRIIDTATGQIKFAETFNARVDNGIKSNDSPVLALEKSILNASQKIGTKILEAIYPFVVEGVNGNTLTIGTGGDIIKVGDKYNLIQYGEKIRDSYTKESLGRKETIIGQIEITNVTSKLSYAKVLNSSIKNLEDVFKPKTFIIRSLSSNQKQNNSKKRIDEKRKKEKEKIDELW